MLSLFFSLLIKLRSTFKDTANKVKSRQSNDETGDVASSGISSQSRKCTRLTLTNPSRLYLHCPWLNSHKGNQPLGG